METLAFLAVVLVALASTAVGARLLLVSRRTRGFPEFVLGLSLAAITGIGFPIVLLTELRETIGPVLTFAADFIGSFAVAIGFAGFYVFTWRVFRPDARWAPAFTMLGAGAALVATGAGLDAAEGFFRVEQRGGKLIGGFEPYQGKILKADVAAQGLEGVEFRQLFCNGRRMHLARYPNFDPQNPYGGGWAYADGKPKNRVN